MSIKHKTSLGTRNVKFLANQQVGETRSHFIDYVWDNEELLYTAYKSYLETLKDNANFKVYLSTSSYPEWVAAVVGINTGANLLQGALFTVINGLTAIGFHGNHNITEKGYAFLNLEGMRHFQKIAFGANYNTVTQIFHDLDGNECGNFTIVNRISWNLVESDSKITNIKLTFYSKTYKTETEIRWWNTTDSFPGGDGVVKKMFVVNYNGSNYWWYQTDTFTNGISNRYYDGIEIPITINGDRKTLNALGVLIPDAAIGFGSYAITYQTHLNNISAGEDKVILKLYLKIKNGKLYFCCEEKVPSVVYEADDIPSVQNVLGGLMAPSLRYYYAFGGNDTRSEKANTTSIPGRAQIYSKSTNAPISVRYGSSLTTAPYFYTHIGENNIYSPNYKVGHFDSNTLVFIYEPNVIFVDSNGQDIKGEDVYNKTYILQDVCTIDQNISINTGSNFGIHKKYLPNGG